MKSNSKIRIKPSHRGRLTELKKRTGKTEAELYKTGSPATRKMITFARSARKWKHQEGGRLKRRDAVTAQRDNTRTVLTGYDTGLPKDTNIYPKQEGIIGAIGNALEGTLADKTWKYLNPADRYTERTGVPVIGSSGMLGFINPAAPFRSAASISRVADELVDAATAAEKAKALAAEASLVSKPRRLKTLESEIKEGIDMVKQGYSKYKVNPSSYYGKDAEKVVDYIKEKFNQHGIQDGVLIKPGPFGRHSTSYKITSPIGQKHLVKELNEGINRPWYRGSDYLLGFPSRAYGRQTPPIKVLVKSAKPVHPSVKIKNTHTDRFGFEYDPKTNAYYDAEPPMSAYIRKLLGTSKYQEGGNIEDGVKNTILKHIMARIPSGEVSPREWKMVQQWAPEVYNTYAIFNDDLTKPKVDEAQRRMYRQRYAESNFDDRAYNSRSKAVGAFQIVPIAYQDYLTRGKGKPGDLYNYEYNKQVRDWALEQVPKDLGNMYSEEEPEQIRLAKRYAGYNWGAGNLRSHLREAKKAGIDTTNSLDWLGWGKMPKETTDYVNWVVLEKEIPGSSKTNSAYQQSLQKHNITIDRFGGRLKRR